MFDVAAHPHQLEACARGAVTELARAEVLDAAWNRLRVAQATGDRWRERASASAYVQAVAEWPPARAVAPGPDPGALYARALLLSLEVRIGGAHDAAEQLDATIAELHAADPAFDPAAHARRVPWACDWVPRGPEREGPPLPDVAGARAAWREALGNGEPLEMPQSDPGVVAAPLRAACERALERQALWPDPLVERHHRTLIAALDAARTTTEVALAAAHAEACLAVEADWNALLHAALVAPLRAACGAADPARAGPLAQRLLGADPRTLARTAQVLDAAARQARQPEVTLGAEPGEAGFELLRDLRAHLASGGELPTLPEARDPLPIPLPERPVPALQARL